MSEQGNSEMVEDQLSTLPDDILSYILSFLAMRDAVKTRLLSRRWRHLCSFSSSLCFDLLSIVGLDYDDCTGIYNQALFETNKSKFLTGVNQFLQFYAGPKISSFKVRFPLGNESASYVDRWVSFALGMGTEKISLRLSYRLMGSDPYDFPCHLLSCGKISRLKHLRLESCMLTPSPTYIKLFNSLITLRIRYLSLNQFHLDVLLSGCLNLELLKLEDTSLPDTVRVSGPLPCLKSLIFYCCKGIGTMEINSLEKLNVFAYSGTAEWVKFIGVPALKTVYLNLFNRGGGGIRYVYNEFTARADKLELLSLAFYRFKEPVIPERMTKLRKLKELELLVGVSARYDLLNIVHILNASPALQKFRFSYGYTDDWDVTTAGRLDGENPHLHLKNIEIYGFKDKSNEMELLSYLLKNCIVLEHLILQTRRKRNVGAGRWIDLPTFPTRIDCEALRNLLLEKRANAGVEICVL